jgi:biopolymer transport protein ExbB/TolQ
METTNLVTRITRLPLFEAEWVLWLLFAMSIVSLGIIAERVVFFLRRTVDHQKLRKAFDAHLRTADFPAAAALLAHHDSFEANVVLFGLREVQRGSSAVEDLLAGGESEERARFSRGLNWLATIGSTAPFIGLFGTVLGIIRAFRDMAGDIQGGASTVMAGISEALVTTAVGLLVAIPALIAYNAFAAALKKRIGNTDSLSRTLTSHLKSVA